MKKHLFNCRYAQYSVIFHVFMMIKSLFRKKVLWLLGCILLFMSVGYEAHSQVVTVPAGNTNNGSTRMALSTFYGYKRSALIYTSAQIGNTGEITHVGFYVNSVSNPQNSVDVRVYMKERTTLMTTGTTYASETSGATLVYGPVTIPGSAFTANTWITIPLTTTFNYSGGTNHLQIMVETNVGGTGNEASNSKLFRFSTQPNSDYFQLWRGDYSPPGGNGIRSNRRPNVQLTFSAPCSGTPDGGTATPATQDIATGNTAAISLTGHTSGGGIAYQWQQSSSSSGPWSNVTDGSGGTTENYTTAGIFETTYYRCIVHCSNSSLSDTSSVAEVVRVYCTPTATTDDNTGITRVQFNTIDNTSTGAPAYTDFTHISTTVESETSYDISVNVNTDGNYTVNTMAWIDWNQDGIFQSSEEYDLGSVTNQSNGLTSLSPLSVTVPHTALAGETTMRIRASYGASTIPSPCGNQNWSEAEDYTIEVEVPTCPRPSALTATNITISDADLSWTSSASLFNVRYNTGADFNPNTGGINISPNPTTTSVAVSGLSANTTIYWYVRADCGGGDTSTWAGPHIFHTACDTVILFPIIEQFVLGEVPPPCWTLNSNNTYTWEYHSSGYANIQYDPGLNLQNEWLISPLLDFTGMIDVQLSFDWMASYYWAVNPYNNYNINCLISTNGGATWTSLWDEHLEGTFNNWQWYTTTLNLTAYAGLSNIMIAWQYIGIDGAEAGLDNIIIDGTPYPCDITGISFAGSSIVPVLGVDNIYYIDVCEGDSISLVSSISCNGCSSSQYRWMINSYDGTGYATYGGNQFNYHVSQAGGYDMALVYHGGNCATDIPLRIRSSGGPVILHVSEPTACAGHPVPVTVGASGNHIDVGPYLGSINTVMGVTDTTFIPDGPYCTDLCYESSVTFTDFSPTARIQTAEDILYLRLNMEHTFIGDMQISLVGPDDCGSVIILQDNYTIAQGGLEDDTYDWDWYTIQVFCGPDHVGWGSLVNGEWLADGRENTSVYYTNADAQWAWDNLPKNIDCGGLALSGAVVLAPIAMGVPNVLDFDSLHDPCDISHPNNAPGTGWDYCWSNNTQYSYALGNAYVYDPQNIGPYDPSESTYMMHRVNPSDPDNETNFYHPYQSFDGLIGCPLNGTWTVRICDSWAMDNGWIFDWEMSIDPSFLPENWNFTTDLEDVDWVLGSNATTQFISGGGGSPLLYDLTPDPGLTTGNYSGAFTVYDEYGCGTSGNITYEVEGVPEIIGMDPGDYVWIGYDGDTYNVSNYSNWFRRTAGSYSYAPSPPDEDINVFIINFCPHETDQPVVISNVECNDLTIVGGAYAGRLDVANDQIIYVKGNFNNQNIFNATNGNVVFNGENLQTVFTNGYPFYNLTMHNTSTGLTLLSDVTASNNLNMISGNITTGFNLLTLGTSIANPGTLTYNSGFVYGRMRRWFRPTTNSGIVSGLFPFGVGTFNRHMLVEFSTPPSTGGTLTAEFIESPMSWPTSWMNINNIPEISAAGICEEFRISSLCQHGFWSVDDGHGLTGGNYDISLTGQGFQGINDICQITALKRVGAGDWHESGDHVSAWFDSGMPVAKREKASDWSNWGFGAGDNNTLPVELIDFHAECHDEGVNLIWITASEFNNDMFIVEKSDNGEYFIPLAFVDGSGTTNSMTSYEYMAGQNSSTGDYFRIQQRDFDGTTTMYGPIYVRCDDNSDTEQSAEMIVYPNPFTSHIHLILTNVSEGPAMIELYDKLGQIVMQKRVVIESKRFEQRLDLEHLSNAVYHLSVKTGSENLHVRIVKH